MKNEDLNALLESINQGFDLYKTILEQQKEKGIKTPAIQLPDGLVGEWGVIHIMKNITITEENIDKIKNDAIELITMLQ
jgi:hypothetical protein